MSDDPTSDFLARERELLGEDAALFSGNGASTPAAGDGSLAAPVSASPPLVPAAAAAAAAAAFTAGSPPPAADVLDGAAAAAMAQPAALPTGLASPSSGVPLPTSPIKELPTEHIKRANDDFMRVVAERDAKEEEARRERLEKAKQEIDAFYKEYDAARARALEECQQRQDALIGDLTETKKGSFWHRVLRVIDVAQLNSAVNSPQASAGPTGPPGLSQTSFQNNSGTVTKTATGLNSSYLTSPGVANANSPGSAAKDVSRFRQVLIGLRAGSDEAPVVK